MLPDLLCAVNHLVGGGLEPRIGTNRIEASKFISAVERAINSQQVQNASVNHFWVQDKPFWTERVVYLRATATSINSFFGSGLWIFEHLFFPSMAWL
jgi:hypothetical protein